MEKQPKQQQIKADEKMLIARMAQEIGELRSQNIELSCIIDQLVVKLNEQK